mgnify:CR=1 FL=1
MVSRSNSRNNSFHSQRRNDTTVVASSFDEGSNSSFKVEEDPLNYSQLMRKLRKASVWPQDVPIVLHNKQQQPCNNKAQQVVTPPAVVQKQKKTKPRHQSGSAVVNIRTSHDLMQRKHDDRVRVLIRSPSDWKIRQHALERSLKKADLHTVRF